MKSKRTSNVTLISALIAAAVLFAGCGGGGGGGGTPATGRGDLNLKVELPKEALQTTYNYSAYIDVLSYDASQTGTSVANTTTTIVYDTTTGKHTGTFSIQNIPVGNNYICKVRVYSSGAAKTAEKEAAQTGTPVAFAGAVVGTISDGVTAPVNITATSTAVALVTLRYAQRASAAMSAVSSTVISQISGASSLSNATSYVYGISGADPFVVSNWTATVQNVLDGILEDAGLVDVTGPTVSAFYVGTTEIATSTTSVADVAYDGTVFKIKFSESMDSTVDLNTQSTLTASGFSITIARVGGLSTTIDATNALNYGAFAWATVTNANDTLTFTLKSNSQLSAAGLYTLKPGYTYNITAWSLASPSNLKDTSGNVLNPTGLNTSGSFTTSSDTTAPTAPTYVYDGTGADEDLTTSTTQLSANWDAGADAESGIAAYYYAIGTTAGATDTKTWTNNGTALSITVSGLTLTASQTYYFSVKAVNGAGLESSVVSSDGITVQGDVTAPTVSSFALSTATTTQYLPSSAVEADMVTHNGTVFGTVYSESMDATVDLNNPTTLSASGFSITIARVGGTSTTIDATNALNYGTFAWTSTTNTNDTLTFTLKGEATLISGGLYVLRPYATYNITLWSPPTNVKDAAGNAVDTTGIAASGSFNTAPATVLSFTPADGATGVLNNQTQFKVAFNESLNTAIDMNNPATLNASGFSVTIARVGGTSTTIDATNALSYGAFAYTTTTLTNDTLTFTLKDNATLSGLGLYAMRANSTYNITSRTVPTNLQDKYGNPIDTATNIAATGSFTTAP
ncbi:MAG: fibronectin type III domain-containing protein [bacterium]